MMQGNGLGNARSFLFVPGDRNDRFEKAASSGADHIILDLEDAVADGRKALARTNVRAWLSQERPAVVRISSVETKEGLLDIKHFAGLRPTGLMLAKAESISGIAAVHSVFPSAPIILLIETAVGMSRSAELGAQPGVCRLAFGSIDFQHDLGILDGHEGLAFFRSQLVLSSRLAGLPSPIDGVTVNVSDNGILRRDTHHARSLGFGAKLCIHPSQVSTVNEIFEPSEEERRWAMRIVAAETALLTASGAVQVDGQMVDRPVLLRAQKILRKIS